MRSTVIMLLAVLVGFSSAQETVTVKQIATLATDLEFGSAEILEWLRGDDITLDIRADQLETLRKLEGLEDVVTYLEKKVEEVQAPLTAQDVIAMWEKGDGEEAIRNRVIETKTRLTLSISEALAMKKAGVPPPLIRFLRTPRKAPGAEPADVQLTTDDIVKRTALGATPEEIVAELVRTDSRFNLTTSELVQLHRDGVDKRVLREVYARNDAKKATSSTSAPAMAEKPKDGMKATTPLSADTVSLDPLRELEVFKDERAGYELLIPKRFVATKEYRGRKALLQLINQMPDGQSGLPDLELSVLMVHPKKGDRGRLTPDRLPAMARTLVDDMKRRFGADRIDVKAGEPTLGWIAGRRAVHVETTSTAATGKGYVGASTILFNDDRIYVLSYSVRLEQSELWRGILEHCVDSFGFGERAGETPGVDGATDRARLESMFEVWRSSLQRLDYTAWNELHRGTPDGIESRMRFLQEAQRINRADQRVELSRIDVGAGTIGYSTFGLDGARPYSLSVGKDDAGWRLTPAE